MNKVANHTNKTGLQCCNGDCNQGRECPIRADQAERRLAAAATVQRGDKRGLLVTVISTIIKKGGEA